jgi:hypothetical protein
VLEGWAIEAARGRGRAFRAGLRTDFKLMPKRSPITAAQIPHGPRWQAIRQALAECLDLSLERGGWRAGYVARSLFFQGRSEAEAPQLALSVAL